MKKLLVILVLAAPCFAQNWSGIIDSTRAADWTLAGISGGIPTRTTICTTLSPGVTASQINTAIANCPAGQVVKLNAGTYNLAGGLVMKTDVTLRGSGADQTLINFSNDVACGFFVDVCFLGNTNNKVEGSGTTRNWTAGYAQGTTVITLSSTTGISAGTILMLDQADDTYAGRTAGDAFQCDTGSCVEEGPSGGQVSGRSQIQTVRVTGVSGNNVTITPPIYMPNWSSGKSPQAWFASSVIKNAGIEDLSLNHANSSTAQAGMAMFNAYNCWVKGVRSLNSNRSHVWLVYASGNVIRDSYFYGTKNGATQSYGIEPYIGASSNLIENNIFQSVVAPFSFNGGGEGNVGSYNYGIRDGFDQSPTQMMGMVWMHSGGTDMNLLEGNVGQGYFEDIIHGTHNFNTTFRNRWIGTGPGKTSQLNPIILRSFSRFHNAVGNVLGTTSVQTTYQVITSAGSGTPIYELGCCDGAGVADDSFVASTLMRWGNYDTVNAANRFVNSEVPTGSAHYPNSVPASQTLPNSFYLSAKPAWFGSVAWPPIGPDVTGGNISGLGGHAYKIPAQVCYESMGGPSDGTGSALAFNAATCYASAIVAPAAPTITGITVN